MAWKWPVRAEDFGKPRFFAQHVFSVRTFYRWQQSTGDSKVPVTAEYRYYTENAYPRLFESTGDSKVPVTAKNWCYIEHAYPRKHCSEPTPQRHAKGLFKSTSNIFPRFLISHLHHSWSWVPAAGYLGTAALHLVRHTRREGFGRLLLYSSQLYFGDNFKTRFPSSLKLDLKYKILLKYFWSTLVQLPIRYQVEVDLLWKVVLF